MKTLSSQFLEVFQDSLGDPESQAIGYYIADGQIDDMHVELRFDPYNQPVISISGVIDFGLMHGGLSYRGIDKGFEPGGINRLGLVFGVQDEYGDRRYWIGDAVEQPVQVATWDDEANTPNPDDGSLGGQYRDYRDVQESEAVLIRELAAGAISIARRIVEQK